MNYTLLCDLFRQNRDYTSLTAALTAPVYTERKPFTVSGLTEGSEQIFLTSLAEDFASADEPLLLLFPEEKKAAAFRDFLLSLDVRAAFFPAREYCFSNIVSSHAYEGERLAVLSALAGLLPPEQKPTVICTTPEAALQITLPPARLRDLCISLSYDEPVSTEHLAERLTTAGYARVELVEAPGQFAIRGFIADIYPPSFALPVRVELFGEDVDRITYFSPDTQRYAEDAPAQLLLSPVRELLLPPDKRTELTEAVRRHLRRLGHTEGADEQHVRAAEVLQQELSALEHGLDIHFADKYLPLLYPEGTCLLDYAHGIYVCCDASAEEERTEAAAALLSQSLTGMIESLELPPLKNGLYMRRFQEIPLRQDGPSVFLDALSRDPCGIAPEAVFLFQTRHVPSYAGNIPLFREDLAKFRKENYTCAVLCANEAEKNTLRGILLEDGCTVLSADSVAGADGDISLPAGNKPPVLLLTGSFPGGYEQTFPKFVLLDFSGEAARPARASFRRKTKQKKTASQAILSYADLEDGDIVVHDTYGIGQYMGLETLTIDGSSRDYVHIRYAGSDKLFLPVDQLDHVSKYIGAGSDTGMVKLSKMGGADWNRAKSKAKASTKEMARELIDLYARRKRTKGIRFDPDDELCREFADAFAYEETDGQLSAINEIRCDMEQEYPMDRLLCGDVGYGKTEVALRAAFKAVMSGHQVAVLVPTTILAYQHYQTFLSRMHSFPVHIDMVSRFRTPSQQAASLRKVARGETDIIIGTHRLISKDVQFADLGLIIVDEEQRFGVAQKEKLKQMAVHADMLTLTATPIPRTLNMAMGGIVDMSVLEEAPGLRSPVQTYVMEYDDAMIYEAVRRELRRGGQVFYLYNRVEGIYGVADRLEKAIPDARIAVAHGKMDRETIEEVWDSLIRGEIDVLVCTTIIETGVDIPNANTLIIEHAENYGLSQLHQIRGRVGRSSTRAYAYFTYPKGRQLTEIAQKRLSALREYAAFGAGFRIALRDLEIRGAGNLLGSEQHGHLEAVGYDLYMKLLEEAVLEEKGEERPAEQPDCLVDVRCDAFLSTAYIASAPQRMDMYKKIARIASEADYDDLLDELCDRYGEPNAAAVNLCRIAWIRALGRRAGFSKIEEKDGQIRLHAPQVDARRVQLLAAVYPSLGVRVQLGQTPYITLRTKQNKRNTEFLLELLTKYAGFSSD